MKTKVKDLNQKLGEWQAKINKNENERNEVVIKIGTLSEKKATFLQKKSEIKKYNFLNIITFGLFFCFKQKKINQKIKTNQNEIDNEMKKMIHFGDKELQFIKEQNKILEKLNNIYKQEINNNSIKFDKNMKNVSNETSNIAIIKNKPVTRRNSI